MGDISFGMHAADWGSDHDREGSDTLERQDKVRGRTETTCAPPSALLNTGCLTAVHMIRVLASLPSSKGGVGV